MSAEILKQILKAKRDAVERRRSDRLLDELKAIVTDQPQLGRPGLRPTARACMVPDTPWIPAYRLREDLVEILHVWYGAQNRRKDGWQP